MGERRVFIVDGHEDIASNALHNNHDVRLSVSEIRAAQSGPPEGAFAALPHAHEQAMIGLPELRLGGVGLVFATIFTFPAEPEASTKAGLDQLFYYHDLARQDLGVRLIRSVSELDALVADWNAAPTPEERPVGMLLLMENADPISKPTELYEWVNGGLRIVGPAWRGSRYAGGTGEPGPLTALGRGLLGEMQRLGVILDISHLAEESFWQALDIFDGASHRQPCQLPRLHADRPPPERRDDPRLDRARRRHRNRAGEQVSRSSLGAGRAASARRRRSAISTTSASSRATRHTARSAATSTAASAWKAHPTDSTRSPISARSPIRSPPMAMQTPTSRVSWAATGCASCGAACQRSSSPSLARRIAQLGCSVARADTR